MTADSSGKRAHPSGSRAEVLRNTRASCTKAHALAEPVARRTAGHSLSLGAQAASVRASDAG